MTHRQEIIGIVAAVTTAFALWFFIFEVSWGVFWIKMAIGASTLAVVSTAASGHDLRQQLSFRPGYIGLGVMTAAALYGVFWVGRLALTWIWPGAGNAISSVYAPRSEFPLWAIAMLLLLLTGPAEEIFWRGFIQRALSRRIGSIGGFLAATGLYTAVHIWTGNVALMMAALIVGLAWGWLYRRTNSLVPGIVSHAIWGVAIFVIWPLG